MVGKRVLLAVCFVAGCGLMAAAVRSPGLTGRAMGRRSAESCPSKEVGEAPVMPEWVELPAPFSLEASGPRSFSGGAAELDAWMGAYRFERGGACRNPAGATLTRLSLGAPPLPRGKHRFAALERRGHRLLAVAPRCSSTRYVHASIPLARVQGRDAIHEASLHGVGYSPERAFRLTGSRSLRVAARSPERVCELRPGAPTRCRVVEGGAEWRRGSGRVRVEGEVATSGCLVLGLGHRSDGADAMYLSMAGTQVFDFGGRTTAPPRLDGAFYEALAPRCPGEGRDRPRVMAKGTARAKVWTQNRGRTVGELPLSFSEASALVEARCEEPAAGLHLAGRLEEPRKLEPRIHPELTVALAPRSPARLHFLAERPDRPADWWLELSGDVRHVSGARGEGCRVVVRSQTVDVLCSEFQASGRHRERMVVVAAD